MDDNGLALVRKRAFMESGGIRPSNAGHVYPTLLRSSKEREEDSFAS